MALYFRTSRASREGPQSAIVVGYSCYHYWVADSGVALQGTIVEFEGRDAAPASMFGR
jgi:hypothetical protein